jgi:hypothetical protein
LLCGSFAIAQQVLFPFLIITLYYEYQLGAETCVKFTMSDSEHADLGFPWFEEKSFSGWLTQFTAHLRKTASHSVLDRPRPQDTDAAGVPIPMNAAQRRTYEQECSDYDKMDNIAYSELMKACRRNPRAKHLSETGGFKTAYALLARLRQRFFMVDEVVKASHLLQYYNLKQQESESGADFVDREAREFNSLRDMGVNVDDSMRLTKFIQQATTNSRHKSLAQTLFTTPNITLNRATSLFETYAPGGQSSAPSVNAIVCGYCKKNGHELKVCRKKIRDDGAKKRKPFSKTHTSKTSSHSKGKRARFPCSLCDDKNHRTHECPRRDEARKCLGVSDKKGSERQVTWGQDDALSDDADS